MAISNYRAQPALQEIASWMTNTLTSVGDGLLATNCSGQVLFMNSRAEQITGCPLERALNQYSSEIFQLIDEELGLPSPSPLCEAFIEEEIVRSDRPSLLVTAKGEEMKIEYTAAPIRNESGKVVGAVVVFREAGNTASRTPTKSTVSSRCRDLMK
jgi:PAS domain S-box-containing protein